MTREQRKVQRWTEREARRKLHTMIIDDDRGGYVAFGRYQLRPEKTAVQVFIDNRLDQPEFSNKRTAISWCVADNYNHQKLAQIIHTLDQKKQDLLTEIQHGRARVHGSKSSQFRELVSTKLELKQTQFSKINDQLEKCLNLAKYIQLKGFQNETARTGRNFQNKTNR